MFIRNNMYYNEPLEILGCKLILTCSACPEQYDVYMDEEQVGYLRLRHGRFTAEYPDVGGKLVYTAYPIGDGVFTQEEREKYLTEAVTAILNTKDSITYSIEIMQGVCADLTYSQLVSLGEHIASLVGPGKG